MLNFTNEGAEKELNRLTSTVDRLIKEGATGPAATDGQKWEVGDTINALEARAGRALGRARRKPLSSTPVPRPYEEKFRRLRERLVDGQPVARHVLVDFARVAAAIPTDDPLRTSKLGFFFARALTMIDDPSERRRWAAVAEKEHYSVARLRAALNAARARNETGAKDPPGVQRGIYVCAQTGQRIVDLGSMIEVRLDRHHPAAPAPLPVRSQQAVLRFKDLPALSAWATGHVPRMDETKPPK